MKSKPDDEKKVEEIVLWKWHLLVFFIVILFLWGLWFFRLGDHGQTMVRSKKFPWPVWPTVIWLMALRIHYSAIYKKKIDSNKK